MEIRDLREAAVLSGSKYSSAGASDSAGVAGPARLAADRVEARFRSDGARRERWDRECDGPAFEFESMRIGICRCRRTSSGADKMGGAKEEGFRDRRVDGRY